ncbi:MAG: sulfite exporter TauE/SafE family protein [Proteobacteria bacterium]|nr:sulfite exporter TauE/SafE family protein [Pseudomonadota bacterium]
MSGIPGEVWLVLASFVAAIASGLAGFAFALIASAAYLHLRLPVDATPLILAASLLAQCFSILGVRDAVDWRRLAPFLVGGVLGIPLGVMLLHGVSPEPLKRGIGAFLVAYSLFMLLRGVPKPVTFGGAPLDAAIGFVGGAMGGLGGLSGAVPTLWTGLRGWSKNEQRGVYQPYIFFMQAVALGYLYVDGGVGPQAVSDFLWCLPAVALGVWVGLKLYARVDDATFRRIVLVLLLASGVVLSI